MGRRRRGRGKAWLLVLVVAPALLLAACATTSRGQPATPIESVGSNTPPSVPHPTVDPSAPNRWGFDPSKPSTFFDGPATYERLPAGYKIETVVSGLQQPTAIAFEPDGTMLVAQQSGAIRVVRDGVLQPSPLIAINSFTPVTPEGFSELGLDGLTVDPNFSQNGYVYAYYSTKDPAYRTVLARITTSGGVAVGSHEILSISVQQPCCHIAGSLRFAPDGTLFVMVGDHQQEAASQDLSTPFGKILRIDRDGSAPPDNPFTNDPAADPRVYAYGLRNPYDIGIDQFTGRIFSTENGWKGQDAILSIRPGANYGWPGYAMSVPLDQVAQPLLFYNRAIGPSGMELYRGAALPAFDGVLFFCQFHEGGALHAVRFDVNGTVVSDNIISTGCTSDVLTGPDGFLYFVDYLSGVVYRIARPQ
jgi:glucose/arabinose dehydrogenase